MKRPHELIEQPHQGPPLDADGWADDYVKDLLALAGHGPHVEAAEPLPTRTA